MRKSTVHVSYFLLSSSRVEYASIMMLRTAFVKYTHQLAYMVNAVRSENPQPVASQNFQEDSTVGAKALFVAGRPP